MQVQNTKFNIYLHLTFRNFSIIIIYKFNKHIYKFLYILQKEGNDYDVKKMYISTDNMG